MKGLLLKDWYVAKKNCKSYLFIAALFLAVSLFSDDNLFFVFYPCMFCGMLPVTLLGYDEQSRWMVYCGTLPYTKAQIVSSKYLIGLLTQGIILLATGIIQGIKMAVNGHFVLNELLVLSLLLLTVSAFTSSISLPFIFKLGLEKGRTAYFVMIGAVCGASVIASSYFRSATASEIQPNLILALVAILGIGAYALSWYLSIVFFQKREIH